jgi:hypothetical protein
MPTRQTSFNNNNNNNNSSATSQDHMQASSVQPSPTAEICESSESVCSHVGFRTLGSFNGTAAVPPPTALEVVESSAQDSFPDSEPEGELPAEVFTAAVAAVGDSEERDGSDTMLAVARSVGTSSVWGSERNVFAL